MKSIFLAPTFVLLALVFVGCGKPDDISKDAANLNQTTYENQNSHSSVYSAKIGHSK